MTWINADDLLLPGAFEVLHRVAVRSEIDWCLSIHTMKREQGAVEMFYVPLPHQIIAAGLCDGEHWQHVMQEGTFWRMRLFKECAEEFRQFKYAGDWFLWFSFARKGYLPYSFPQSTACFFFRSGQVSEEKKSEYDLEIFETRKRYQEARSLESFRDEVLVHGEVTVDPYSDHCRRVHHKLRIVKSTGSIYELGVERFEYLSSEYNWQWEMYGGRKPTVNLLESLESTTGSVSVGESSNLQIRHVVSPLTRREIPDLKFLIVGCPKPSQDSERLQWHLVIDSVWTDDEIQQIRMLITSSHLDKVTPHFHSVGLAPEESIYIRWDPEVGEMPPCELAYGLKSGPNLQFFRSLKFVQQYQIDEQDAVLLLEMDNFPLRKFWVDELNVRLAGLPVFLVAGMHYQGETLLMDSIKYHLNGNAVYGIGHPGFKHFISLWEEVLVTCVSYAQSGPNVAYDVAIEYFLDKFDEIYETIQLAISNSGERDVACDINQYKQAFMEFKEHFFTLNDLLIHLEGPDEQRSKKPFDIGGFVEKYPNACLVHSKAAGLVWNSLTAIISGVKIYHHPLNREIQLQRLNRKHTRFSSQVSDL